MSLGFPSPTSFLGSPSSWHSVQYNVASLSGRQFTPRGPTLVEFETIGMFSAKGKSQISLTTLSVAASATQTFFGNLPQGTAYENGRFKHSKMTYSPHGLGSTRVKIFFSPLHHIVVSFVLMFVLTSCDSQ